MARRERRAYPQRSVRSEQRRQAAQSASALRVAPLLVLARVAPQSQTTAGMLLRRLLGPNQNRQQRDPCQYFNRLLEALSSDGLAAYRGPSARTSTRWISPNSRSDTCARKRARNLRRL